MQSILGQVTVLTHVDFGMLKNGRSFGSFSLYCEPSININLLGN